MSGGPMNDQNILKRHLQPASFEKLGFYVNWRCLRTSHATWMVQAGADAKSVQGQMRHSRSSTTMDIYAQIVPVAQRHALDKLSRFVTNVTNCDQPAEEKTPQLLENLVELVGIEPTTSSLRTMRSPS